MRNQLRLGRFTTQRQGAHFVESWSEGFAFQELTREQLAIVQQKEELEKQRKLLAKRKTGSVSNSGKETVILLYYYTDTCICTHLHVLSRTL